MSNNRKKDDATTNASSLDDEEYLNLRPHAFHLQLPPNHKTDSGVPYATISAHRKARALVKLVDALSLKEDFFVDDRDDKENDGGATEKKEEEEEVLAFDDDEEMDGGEEDIDACVEEDDAGGSGPSSLHQLTLHCNRIQSQLTFLSDIKPNYGLSRREVCEMLLKILGLLCATVEIVEEEALEDGVSGMAIDEGGGEQKRKRRVVKLYNDDVGYILGGEDGQGGGGQQGDVHRTTSAELLEDSLAHPFALLSPARQALLGAAMQLLEKKDQLRGASNSAIVPDKDNDCSVGNGDDDGSRRQPLRLVVSHRALLRMLLRTAPYLDEREPDVPPKEANKLKSAELKRTVTLIRSCRRFFDQGGLPAAGSATGTTPDDATARELWSALSADLRYHTHSNSCFRALIMLYLFHPSKCSGGYYSEVLPTWMDCWRGVDRCPEWDYLWLVLISRARKHLPSDDPRSDALRSSLRKHMLTQCGYWLQVPVGGMSSDKSFPQAQSPARRSFPYRLKAFVGAAGRYEEGMDFVARLCKVLMFCAGPAVTEEEDGGEHPELPAVSEGTSDLLRFLAFVAPYYNPSNTGSWAFPLGAFVYYLSYELCARVGVTAGWEVLRRDHPGAARRLVEEEPYLKCIDLPGNEILAFLDRLLPLCQQALYSKIPTVSHAGEMALLYLAQIDPVRVSPPLIDFSLRALDISSVNLSHQAPAALCALSCLLQPALRAKSSIVLSRLPVVLRLTLAGIDSNDQQKSLRTLIFYRNLVMWIPVGGSITLPDEGGTAGCEKLSDSNDGDGTEGTMQIGERLTETRYCLVESQDYKAAVAALSENSILFAEQTMVDDTEGALMQEAMLAMSDWSLSFLDRIYELLRAAGEQEKMGKGHGGVGMRHTSADVAMTKNFSRIMKETMIYLFASMDDPTYEAALRSVARFLGEETLPFAAKDASLLCQAVCSTRFASGSNNDTRTIDMSPGLNALVPILTEDLEHMSNKSAIYRLRCLAGAVRYAGSTLLKHRVAITSAISFALSKSDDRALFKTGCKLLRHTLSSQCEEYPIAQGVHPMRLLNNGNSPSPVLGMSALLRGDRIWWHVPSGKQIDFTVSLLSQFAVSRWMDLGTSSADGKAVAGDANVNLQQWRQSLRVLRYTLRGCAGILLDEDPEVVLTRDKEICPKEMATAKLILAASSETKKILQGLRRRICFNLMDIMSLIAKDTVDCESLSNGEENESRQYKKNEMGSISMDSKICKEVVAIVSLILTRRGAQYRSGTGKSILQGQQEILTNWCLSAQTDFLSSMLSRSNDEFYNQINDLYYEDGENSGKTLSRALLVNSIHLTNQALTGYASSQVPRRLRKLRGGPSVETPESLFSLDMALQTLREHLRSQSGPYSSKQTSLEAYEALVDGLCAMSCHPNINVRGNALNNTDFAFTRFGWVVKHRTSRLLAALSLNDDGQKGVHGIPSCSELVNQINSQGKRSRLAEVVKGVTKIVALPKVMKQFLWGANNRFELVKTLCGTQKLLKLLPPEEVPKVVHYVNSVFLSYRSKLFSLPRNTEIEQKTHESCLAFLLSILQMREGNNVTAGPDKNSDDNDAGAMHWRDRLVAAWFVLQFIDERDLMVGDEIVSQVWSTCFKLIEEEQGQPLQRVSLGLLGRLVSLALVDMSQMSDRGNTKELKCPDLSALCAMFQQETFCRAFGNALVFDHREDSSVGGGHSAQWSSGVEEIIRDATSNLSRRTLFPFNRISQKSRTFKLQHSQLVESILLAIGHDNAKATSRFLLGQAKELVASPPSEDQRNQQVTSAEIFAGCTRALIQYSKTEDERDAIWETLLLPFLDEAVVKMPTDFLPAFFDAIRYAIHHFPPGYFLPLLKWSVTKVKNTLWQHETDEEVEESNGAASAIADRFALQGKWLVIFQAVLVELDNEDDLGAAVCKVPWYLDIFIGKKEAKDDSTVTPTEIELGQSWTFVNDHLTPCLLNAIGHPYEKCRDHIAACLFRMCFVHRKFISTFKAMTNENQSLSNEDPGIEITKELGSIRDSEKYSFKEKNRALGTARKFVSCCVHWGDAKHEYSQFIIPLLPLAFKSLQTIEGEVSPEDRGIEAELVKGYRYAIADLSSSCVVCYGVSKDISLVLDVLKEMSSHEYWQIRSATAHFLRCFQGAHKFLFTKEQDEMSLSIAISLLADDRREVSTAATSALTGILAVFPQAALEELVSKYIKIANKSLKKKKRKTPTTEVSSEESAIKAVKEKERAVRQQKSVFVLCAVVMGRPYDTPMFVPEALATLSKHSFEQRASLGVREVVKMVCSEFKRTHTDNWEAHRKQFTQEQLEALEDVVSTPHYYA